MGWPEAIRDSVGIIGMVSLILGFMWFTRNEGE
jgi:hypothetical protein